MATNKPKKKTTAKTTVAKIPQPHGGALNAGGTPGNAGGSGRPPSALRALLTEGFEARIPKLFQIADGETVQRMKIDGIETDTLISADVSDRLKAFDLMGKYGPGTVKEISVEDVRGRMQLTIDAIKALTYPIASPDVIIAAMRPYWERAK